MDAIFKGIALSLLLVFSVGPVIFTIIKQSIVNGRSGGFSFVAGVWLSDLLIIILSNAFSELVKELLDFKLVIGVVGSIFLLGMGIFYLFFKKIQMRSESEPVVKVSAGTHAKLVASGFFLNTLNPAVFFFWFTTATTIAVSNTVKERIIIFVTCVLINLSADIFKVILAGKLSKKLNHKNIKLVNRISGTLLVVFGLILLFGIIYADIKH